LIEAAPDVKIKRRRLELTHKARERIVAHVFPEIVMLTGGRPRFVDQPPLHDRADTSGGSEDRWLDGIEEYRRTLPDKRRVLFDRDRVEDCAQKVVGIGSVGTRCGVALLFSEENHPLILQVKEAGQPVLEPFPQKCRNENPGQRVAVGQRLTQSSSEIFPGRARSRHGHDFISDDCGICDSRSP